MFSKTKIALIGVTLSILAGCTGTTYNDAKNCTEDYLLQSYDDFWCMEGRGSCGVIC